MRVTNEQAKADIVCQKYPTCVGCPNNPDCKSVALEASKTDYAADLLEARELIKEVRGQMKQIQMYTAESQVFEQIQIWGKTFLDKSKEFAE